MNIPVPVFVIRSLQFLILIVCAYPVYFSISAMLNGTSRADVIVNGIFLLGSLYLFGLVCSILYTGMIAENLTDFFLYPRRYLKTAPVILSKAQGLIHRGNYEQAELELLQMRSETPASPELTILLSELHADLMNDKEAAVADCVFYFKHRNFRRHELNLQILFRCIQWMCDCGLQQKAAAQLDSDSRLYIYTAAERQKIKARSKLLFSGREQSSEK